MPYQLTDIHLKIAEVLISKLQKEPENALITYKELSNKIGGFPSPRNLSSYLGDLSAICKENDMPLISSIVVNGDTMMPGNGFYSEFFEHIKSEDERIEKWILCLKDAQEYRNWGRLKKILNID